MKFAHVGVIHSFIPRSGLASQHNTDHVLTSHFGVRLNKYIYTIQE